jgi:hypothetical protein
MVQLSISIKLLANFDGRINEFPHLTWTRSVQQFRGFSTSQAIIIIILNRQHATEIKITISNNYKPFAHILHSPLDALCEWANQQKPFHSLLPLWIFYTGYFKQQ